MGDPCMRLCHGRSCGSLRYPPSGVAPMQCSSLEFLSCDCTGCCLNTSRSLLPCPYQYTPCEFACALQDIQPPGCKESTEHGCRWCSDFTSGCDSLFFIDPWQKGQRTVARRCQSAGAKCAAEPTGTVCSEALRCEGRDGVSTTLDIPLPLRPRASPPPLTSSSKREGDTSGSTVHAQKFNSWWTLGKPSNDVSQAGVLLHQFDAISPVDSQKPWAPCEGHDSCAKYTTIWPSSIINKFHHNRLYRVNVNFRGFGTAPFLRTNSKQPSMPR
ncbi:MAG: hypothetical protein SGPRY_007130 [Prymnesium sp.]